MGSRLILRFGIGLLKGVSIMLLANLSTSKSLIRWHRPIYAKIRQKYLHLYVFSPSGNLQLDL